MRLDLPKLKERFGAVMIYGTQSVYELDSGPMADGFRSRHDAAVQRIPYERLHAALRDLAIVVPVKEEKLKLLDGVLAGIPNACRVIIVSNSTRGPVDRFQLECDLAQSHSAYTNRPVVCVHQKDPKIAQAFKAAGYADVIGDDGLVRNGKAEGMIIGTLLAQKMGARAVGFVDSDNYFPGAVLEYCHIFAAGMAMSRRKDPSRPDLVPDFVKDTAHKDSSKDYTMVRISWNSKPKVMDNGLYFAKWGRSSVVTNKHLNRLVSHYTGFETEAIRTGNAGEHAMSMDLALQLGWSNGYSIEPYQYVYLMEQFGGIMPPPQPNVPQRHVNIYQIESRNPHLHESKGDEHVERMIESSLSVIYHSPLCSDKLKAEIERELDQRGIRPAGDAIPTMRTYKPLATADLAAFNDVLKGEGYGSDTPEILRPA